jgi:hypothetical protein
MLGHAPEPLTARGLDMRNGHPAEEEIATKRGSHASAPLPATPVDISRWNRTRNEKNIEFGDTQP